MKYLIIFLWITYFIWWAYFLYNIKKDDDIIEKTKKSIVIIKNEKNIIDYEKNPLWIFEKNKNTGIWAWFFIDKKWTILTANHLVENTNNKYIAIYKQKKYNLKVITRDIENDIAKVKIKASEDLAYLNISKQKHINEEIISFWIDKNLKIVYNTWSILNYGSWKIIEISNIIKPWFSWWPIINKDWEVIWINYAIIKDKFFWVDIIK